MNALNKVELLELPKTLTVGGVATKPHEFAVESGRLDLRELLGWKAQGKIAYVYIPFHVREDGLNDFGIGADWWHKAWIDGEVISDTLAGGNGRQPPTMMDHLSKVQLRKGKHLLVVHFINGSAGAVLNVGGASQLRRVYTDRSAGVVTGIYDPRGRVRFETRPIREWEFMATGTGVTGVTVNFPEEMVLQVNHSAAIDEQGLVRALSRLHLNLEGSPFADSKSFRMETDFRKSLIRAEAQTASGPVRVEIRAHVPLDAFRIDIYDERQTPGALSIRFEEDAPAVALASGRGLFFFHENPSEGKGINSSTHDWLAGRTFGLCVELEGDGVQCAGKQMTLTASKHQVLYIVGASEQKGKDAFLKSVAERTRQLAALSQDEFIASHEEWWRPFWTRSYFEPDGTNVEYLRYRAAFDLFRYYTACCTSDRRETPARFQIELYRYHLRQHVWLTMGICAVEMYQSVFGTMRTGDWETLRSEYFFLKENLPFYKEQARRIQGVNGAFIPMGQAPWTHQESCEVSPAANELCSSASKDVPYNGDNPAGPLFMLALGCDYADLSGDRTFINDILRPLATEVMEYFRLRYPPGADGKIAFDPCNAGETWRAVRNPAEIVCAFRFALARVIAVGDRQVWAPELLAQWREMLSAAPEIPRGRLVYDENARDIKPAILPGDLLVPAQSMEGCKSYVLPWSGKKAWYSVNSQQTELFAIWPTKLMLRSDEDRRRARESYKIRFWQHRFEGWDLDVVHAACLGLLDEVLPWFDKHFDRTYVLPCGLARETAPTNPACTQMPEYPSLQGMGTGVIPVLEMLLSDYPDLLIILPCWDPKVAVRYALMSPFAGKVTVDYDPARGATVTTERPIRVQGGEGIRLTTP